MNHPKKEEWMSFLYDEISSQKRSELNAHLEGCRQCQTFVTGSQKLKGRLDEWQLRSAPKRRIVSPILVKWAAAAVFMVCVAFGLGRLTAPRPDIAAIRSAIEPTLQTQFDQKLKAAREADRKSFISMLREVEQQRLSDYTALRKDLETVAVVADEKLTTTQQALNQLNLYAQSEPNKEQSIK